MTAKIFLPLLCTILFMQAPIVFSAVDAPHEIGGFKLGSFIDDYEFISYRNYLKQVVIEDIEGFRKGIIYYGVCDRPGEIVKIKLKYADGSENFYKQLLKRYKKKLGRPDEYVGDSFGIRKAWKWRFTDKDGNGINLILQYNKKDPNESLGSVVKLSMPDRVEAERLCFNKMCAMHQNDAPAIKPRGKALDWELLIPR